MNRNFALSLCIACGCCSGAAFADDITIDPHPFVSTMTRAQVREDLRLFQASGTNPWADDYNQLAGMQGTATRAEAKADFLASRKMVAAFSGEDSGSSYLAKMNARPRMPATRLALKRSSQVAHEE
jgi:hypothetical protein